MPKERKKALKTFPFSCLVAQTCSFIKLYTMYVILLLQWNLDLRKPDLRKNLDLRKIVGTTDFLVHKLFDLRKIF